MRIVFMGSPEFAVPSLNALVEAGHEVVAVYTQPPRPAGRGKAEQKTAVHQRAEQLGIEVRTPRTLRDPDEQERFHALDADHAVVAAYGLILPKPILDAPKHGCINVHASLLPRWRGAAPIQRAILAGDEVTGVTIMQMEEGLDTGPGLVWWGIDIDRKTAGELTEDLAEIGYRALQRYLDEPDKFSPVPQSEDGVTYAPKIDKSEARIDWTQTAEQIERKVRAFNPVPGAWFEVGGERVKLLDAECLDGTGSPGEVVGEPLVIACGEDALHCRTLQRAGKSAMGVEDFLRGFPIPVDTILK